MADMNASTNKETTEEILEETENARKAVAEETVQGKAKAENAQTDELEAEVQESDAKQDNQDEKDNSMKGFFKKKKDKKDEQIEELTDRLKRSLAEFDNFRKRTEKEKASMYDMGAKSVVEKILPIVDNFERGLAAVPTDEKGSAFADGMDKIYKQLMKTLEDMDVKPIPAVGEPFDPNLHNAVMHIENEELGENVIAAEFQKGYTYKGSVVRHSMVQVAN
ncbi:MAG: nucleotide exchange factor GrpE [Lachnospiraceae bacterium]